MECQYSGMSGSDFDSFTGEALCFVDEAMGVISYLTGHYISPGESLLNGALYAVERSLSALRAFLNTENNRYFAQQAEIDKKRALAGCRPAKAPEKDGYQPNPKRK